MKLALEAAAVTAAWLLPIAARRENAKLTSLCDDRTPEGW